MARDLRPGEVIPVDIINVGRSAIAEIKVLDGDSIEVTTTRGVQKLIGNEINKYPNRLSLWDLTGKNVTFSWHWEKGKER
jgi:hypothetical protein